MRGTTACRQNLDRDPLVGEVAFGLSDVERKIAHPVNRLGHDQLAKVLGVPCVSAGGKGRESRRPGDGPDDERSRTHINLLFSNST
jgi:hypothetical protein